MPWTKVDLPPAIERCFVVVFGAHSRFSIHLIDMTLTELPCGQTACLLLPIACPNTVRPGLASVPARGCA